MSSVNREDIFSRWSFSLRIWRMQLDSETNSMEQLKGDAHDFVTLR